jgi:hypothetical protein
VPTLQANDLNATTFSELSTTESHVRLPICSTCHTQNCQCTSNHVPTFLGSGVLQADDLDLLSRLQLPSNKGSGDPETYDYCLQSYLSSYCEWCCDHQPTSFISKVQQTGNLNAPTFFGVSPAKGPKRPAPCSTCLKTSGCLCSLNSPPAYLATVSKPSKPHTRKAGGEG